MAKACTLTVVLFFALNAWTQERPAALTPQDVDEIVSRLQESLNNYVFPEMAGALKRELQSHRPEYRVINDAKALAARLTSDLRAAGNDHHLQVLYGGELALQKEPTPEERQHAHAFDVANGYGIRSGRRLPGNIGYVDFAYFSPDVNAGEAVAAVMQLISGTDALILDLRRNGGGSGDTANALLSYFFEEPIQMSSIVERQNGQVQERQKWTMPFVQGPRYLGKPVFVLTSRRTHSAAEFCAYELKVNHRAFIVGERTAGDANSSTGTITLGYGFAAWIPNGQPKSPVTHSNWDATGVEPDIVTNLGDALVAAYKAALKNAGSKISSPELEKERQAAIENPKSSLLEEVAGFPKK